MTDQDNLRDRIEQIIEDKTYAMALDGFIAGTEDAAQAIIDELGLTVEAVGGNKSISLADWRVVESPVKTRIVGKWEPECPR